MNQHRQAKKSGLAHRLLIELLEDRTMLASDVAAFNEFLQADLDAMDSTAYVESSASNGQCSSFMIDLGPVDVEPPTGVAAPVIATTFTVESTIDVILPIEAIDSVLEISADNGSEEGSPSPVSPVRIVMPGRGIGYSPELPLEIEPVVINPDVPVITIERPTGISPVDPGLGSIPQPPTFTQPVEAVSAPVHADPTEAAPSVAVNDVYPAAVLVNYDPATQVATYDYYTSADAPSDRRTTVVDGYNVYRLSSLFTAGNLSKLVGDDAQAQALNARRDANQWSQYFGVSINPHAGSEALGLYDPAKLEQEIASYAGYTPAERALLETSAKQTLDNLRGLENWIAMFQRRIYETGAVIAETGPIKSIIGFETVFAAIDRLVARMNELTNYQPPQGASLVGGTISDGTTRVEIPMSEWLTLLKTREVATRSVMLGLNLIEISMPTLSLHAVQLNFLNSKDPFVNVPISPASHILKGIGMTIGESDLQEADAIPHYWDFVVRLFDTRIANTESQMQQQFAFMTGNIPVNGASSPLGLNSTQSDTLIEQRDGMFALMAQSGTSDHSHDHATGSNLATLVTQYNMDEPS